MEDSHLKELLRESVLPVILQNGLSAHRLSMRIFRRYKIVSLLCGNRKSLLDTLDLSCGFMRLFRTSDERIAAEQLCDLADEYDYIFCHNEALLYEYIEEYDPALFARIQALVKAGKWHIMGGWYVQPDCNIPSGEGFVRQIESGLTYFKEKFNISEIHGGIRQKGIVLDEIMKRHNLKANEVLYIGDDINDIAAMELVKYRIAPKNVNPVLTFKVQNLQITEAYGGNGAIREIADILSGNL